MLVADLAEILNAEGIALFAGNVLNVNYIPELPHAVVVISDGLAEQPEITMRTTTPTVEHPRIQCRVRDLPQEFVAAEAKCRSVYNRFCQILDTAIGSARVTLIPLSTPWMAGRDEQQRVIYLANFQATIAY